MGKSYLANRRQRVCPGCYIFDINHARTARILFETRQPHFFTAAIFFFKTLPPFCFILPLFLFFFFFNRSFLFANPCPKFDSGRNDVENVALLAKDIFFFPPPDENNKRIKPYIDSIPRFSRGLIFRRIYSYFYAKIKKKGN